MQRVAYKLAADAGLSVWSQSKLRMFECPRAGYLKYVEGRPEPESEAARVGRLLHVAIAATIGSEMRLGPEEAVARAAREVPGVPLEQVREATDLLAGLKIGVRPDRLVGVEDEIVRPLSGSRAFYAGLDVLEIEGSQGWITDWKTDRAVRSEREASGDLQVLSYAWAVMDEYPQLDTVTVTLFFVRYNRPVSVSFVREEVAGIGTFLDDRTRELEERLSDPASEWPPAPGERCQYCPYSLDCPAVQAGQSPLVIRSDDEAEAVAGELAALGRRAAVLRDALYGWVKQHGRVAAAGQVWDFWPSTTYELRPGTLRDFLQTLAARGVVPDPYLRLNGKTVPSLLDDPELAAMILPVTTPRFEARKARP